MITSTQNNNIKTDPNHPPKPHPPITPCWPMCQSRYPPHWAKEGCQNDVTKTVTSKNERLNRMIFFCNITVPLYGLTSPVIHLVEQRPRLYPWIRLFCSTCLQRIQPFDLCQMNGPSESNGQPPLRLPSSEGLFCLDEIVNLYGRLSRVSCNVLEGVRRLRLNSMRL